MLLSPLKTCVSQTSGVYATDLEWGLVGFPPRCRYPFTSAVSYYLFCPFYIIYSENLSSEQLRFHLLQFWDGLPGRTRGPIVWSKSENGKFHSTNLTLFDDFCAGKQASKIVKKLRWPDARESSKGSRPEPLFCESRFGALKLANRRFEAIRVNRSNVVK